MMFFLIRICLLIVFAIPYTPLTALDLGKSQNAKNDLRIQELLPLLLSPCAVNPYIPADFVALSESGMPDLYDWIYWGPKEVLEAYFKDTSSLKVPLLRVSISGVGQTGIKAFDGEEFDKFIETVKKQWPNENSSMVTLWGDYPVVAIQAKMEDRMVYSAWVGLNDPHTHCVLLFNLVYPREKLVADEEALKLWNDFITKTTKLKDGDFFKACGQDMQDGYTNVNYGGAKLKVIAEKRERDRTMQVVVIPEGNDVDFKYADMNETAMGAKWRFGEPMVKVSGEIKIDNDDIKAFITYVTSVFYKTVPEFSIDKDKDENKKLLIFQKKFK